MMSHKDQFKIVGELSAKSPTLMLSLSDIKEWKDTVKIKCEIQQSRKSHLLEKLPCSSGTHEGTDRCIQEISSQKVINAMDVYKKNDKDILHKGGIRLIVIFDKNRRTTVAAEYHTSIECE